ncbi:MAG: metal ABC transporter permease [bacterium]|nr:metal ABC transporter permease [bacterium]
MTQSQLEIQFVAALVAAACALPGVLLVLRRVALMSDAISHTVLLGIVIGFTLLRDIENPLLIVFAAGAGVLTVSLTELLLKTRRVHEDAAIGLVFPALFSIAVILITQNFSDVHLDVDAVLLGELAFAPFNRLNVLGLSLPRGAVVMGAILLLNLALLVLFYKELKLAAFDAALASALGFSPILIHYGLMTIVSVTAVGAFDHVGSVLVIALMIAPPAAAYLLTDHLGRMFAYSVIIGVLSAIAGYWVARALNVNISGAMASIAGALFLAALLFAPERGLVARQLQRTRRRYRFAVEMLLVHLKRHENTPDEAAENSLSHLVEELGWKPELAKTTVQMALGQGWIERQAEALRLTEPGRRTAADLLAR